MTDIFCQLSDHASYMIKSVVLFNLKQGLYRLEKYLNIQDCLEKSLKIKSALKSTG